MKLKILIAMLASCSAAAVAQDKITVPLSSPSQPATVRVRLLSGSITVTAGGASQVTVEETGRSPRRRSPEPPAGMHRIETGNGGIQAEEDHNVVTIVGRGPDADGDYLLQVPANCSLKLATVNGKHIEVTGVNGVIEVDSNNGYIDLKNVSGSVLAHALNGPITAVLDKVAPDKPMAFTSLNGKIDVTLPADAKARIRLKTDNGSVFSDFAMKMDSEAPKPVVEDSRGQGGRYRIRMDHGVYGSINGGGPEYRFETMNGNILIHRK